MVKDLIVNGSLIISILFLSGHIFKNNKLCPTAGIKFRILAGIISGSLGSLLMLFSIRIADTIIVDLRNIALIIATISGGWVSSVISVILMVLMRIGVFGFNSSSIAAVIILIILSASFILILKLKNFAFKQKFWIMVNFSIVVAFIAFYVLIDDKEILWKLYPSYGLILLGVALFCLLVMTYIEHSNALFRRFKEESKIDFLTGLYNVRQFDESYNVQLEIAKERNENLSVLIIDIDHFKKVNDTYGHSDGDMVLQRLGGILKNKIRNFDIVARSGGEEFSVLLLDCARDRALDIAEKIRSAVEDAMFPISNGIEIHITVSIGVATFPETLEDTDGLLKQADNALYCAKRKGRNRVCSPNYC